MNPYRINSEKLLESDKITDPKEILKLKLVAALLKATSRLETSEILSLTGLHKSDLSRLRSFNTKRFTIDRLIGHLDSLGYSTKIQVSLKKVS